jgi:hypothetical protein
LDRLLALSLDPREQALFSDRDADGFTVHMIGRSAIEAL